MVDITEVCIGDKLKIVDGIRCDTSKYIVGNMIDFGGGIYDVADIGRPFDQDDIYIRLETADWRYWWHPSVLEYTEKRLDMEQINLLDLYT